ncbi:MAG TPA: DNA (cytosine-5-)-methyltransferase [Candidatus Scalindua sp.]|nr:DNA (cytosine-5-)-methyltransferase [Candidatus Scalindua sp.]
MRTNIRFIDLFAGIGGVRNGLEKVYNKYASIGKESEQKECTQRGEWNIDKRQTQLCNRNRTTTFRCVWSNEWNKYARQIYKKHYGECDGRDIRIVPTSEIPNHDLFCAGFPCPTFSIAGKRKGFEDIRGAVFFEIPRILADKRPRYFLLENVKGLLSHQEGKTFQTILRVLSDLGYRVEWQVLNSKHFGVPQNRERVFIIGHLGGESGFQIFPIREGSELYLQQSAQNNAQISNCLDANYYKGWLDQGQRTMINLHQKRTGEYGDGTKTMEQASFTLDSGSGRDLCIAESSKIRRLTPIECERLQGFPDNWTEGISDTQRYKCLGNAVTTNVITAIGSRFIKSVEAEKTGEENEQEISILGRCRKG